MSLKSQSSLSSLNSHIQPPPSALHPCIATLEGHSSYVSALIVHGDSLYSGSIDQEIRVWNSIPTSNDNTSSDVVTVCDSAVKSLVISGNRLLTAHQDHRIRVWHMSQNPHHKNRLRLQAVLPTPTDRLVSCLSPHKYVQVRRHKTCSWVHHVDSISALALSHDGSLLYSVSWDRTLKVWRTCDLKCMESVARAHDDAINALVVSPDGHVYTASADTTIKVWRRAEGERKHSFVRTLVGHNSAVNAVALGGDGSVLYSGASDRSVVVWEVGGEGWGPTGALRGHSKAILCLAAVAEVVCSGSADKTVRVWRRGGDRGYHCVAVLEGHTGPIKSLAIVRGDRDESSYMVYSGSLDCSIKVWRLLPPPSEA